MFSPEDQQIEICLLKSNLEEIENGLIVQHSALPALEVENELKYRETMTALRVVRSLNSEIEQLKHKNVQLTAKRIQLERQCEDISRELRRARSSRSDLETLLKQEEHDTEQEIRQYEEELREIADRFRKTRVSFNMNELEAEIESVNKLNNDLENEEKSRQSEVITLRRELDVMQARVPQSLLDIVGLTLLNEKLKALSIECDTLKEKWDDLLNGRDANPRVIQMGY